MNESIEKRKSVRKYKSDRLDETTLGKIRAKADGVNPLYRNIKVSVEIAAQERRAIFIWERYNKPLRAGCHPACE